MRKKVKKAQRGITAVDAFKKLRTRGRRNVERAERPLKINKKGITKPKLSTGKVDTTKKNNKTKKQLTLDALKKAPLGSNKRRTLYNRLGWKQDATTTGSKVKAKKRGLKTSTAPKIMSGKVSTAKKASVSKPASKMAKKVSATRAKGKKALASGNKAKALRMKKKEARQTKRAIRKTKRK